MSRLAHASHILHSELRREWLQATLVQKGVDFVARILLVDDEKTILVVLGAVLRSDGNEVVAADNAEDALALLAKEKFDLLITDVRMRPTSGFDLLKRAKEQDSTMAVLVVSAYYSRETAKKAEALGAYAFVRKPFDSTEIATLVGRAVRQTEEDRAQAD